MLRPETAVSVVDAPIAILRRSGVDTPLIISFRARVKAVHPLKIHQGLVY
jgi:hypothetical protein